MLQNWPIRSKLVAILILPLVALTIFSAIQVRTNLASVSASDRIRTLADFSVKVNDLIDALQEERYATSTFVGSGFRSGAEDTLARRGPTDTALGTYQTEAAGLPASATKDLQAVLGSIQRELGTLPDHRQAVDQKQVDRTKNATFYNKIITDLLGLIAQVGLGTDNAELVSHAASLTSMTRAKEAAAQQRGNVSIIIFHQSSVAVIKLIQSNAGAEDAWIAQFRTTASQQQQDFYDKTIGSTANSVSQMRDGVVFATQLDQQITVDPLQWVKATEDKLARMSTVENQLSTDLTNQSNAIASTATRGAWLGGLAVALVLAVSIGISLLVASPMIRQLRRLRGAALEVANKSLPDVVERLHKGEAVNIEAEAFPLAIRTKDEIGQVADAFTTVHRVAVRTAVEQAAMRKSIGDTFLNLARRSQALIHRQLKVIDGLERKETDPDELAELFRLDHLATRMRRHAEDLIVLSGSKPARGWRRPVPLKDVVRGAVAEVEDYTRVKVLPISGSAVGGHAVGDVIHMLAELIENATSFSPPHTPVHVSGHEVSNGCVVEVEDRGLGMTDEEYSAVNERLSNPPPFDLQTSERLGLFVVGRLAQRHSIQVQLRPSPYGGTLGIVLLPTALLRAADGTTIESNPATHEEAAGPVPAGSFASSFDGSAEPDEFGDLMSVGAPVAASSNGSGDDRPLMDDLPVFATIRSSWFVSEREATGGFSNGNHGEPSRPRPRLSPSAEPDDWAELPGPSIQLPDSSDQWGQPPDTGAHRAEPAGPWDEPVDTSTQWATGGFSDSGVSDRVHAPDSPSFPPAPSFSQPSFSQPSSFSPGPSSTPASALPPAETARTDTGLPKRKRRASLAPELRGAPVTDATTPPVLAGPRSPEEIRNMMSSFQANFGRGLQAGPNPNGDDARKVM
ncbi:nitrate- and nitrite sensing domain-containing protein [Frankia sp. Cas3]|uniref:sensor histidine kinase n=1 Tax=Frankia sp. Cas3 TaxID=3073926 RepID=UPI002AD3C509|nr:nitrate- and nitrite sensing domain-containing protein [Frankia sp. Cas3]